MPSAQRTIGQPSSRWEIHPWHSCQAKGESWAFPDRSAALIWVKQFRSDTFIMGDFRALMDASSRVGSGLWRKSDEQILNDLSWLLSEGVLHVHRVAAPRTAWHSGEATAAEIAPAASRPTPSKSSGESPIARILEEADTFSSQVDAAATAAVLNEASATGVSFCEECAKAAAAARKAA